MTVIKNILMGVVAIGIAYGCVAFVSYSTDVSERDPYDRVLLIMLSILAFAIEKMATLPPTPKQDERL